MNFPSHLPSTQEKLELIRIYNNISCTLSLGVDDYDIEIINKLVEDKQYVLCKLLELGLDIPDE